MFENIRKLNQDLLLPFIKSYTSNTAKFNKQTGFAFMLKVMK